MYPKHEFIHHSYALVKWSVASTLPDVVLTYAEFPRCPILGIETWMDDDAVTHARVRLPDTMHIVKPECRRNDLAPDWRMPSRAPISCEACLEAVDRALLDHMQRYQ